MFNFIYRDEFDKFVEETRTQAKKISEDVASSTQQLESKIISTAQQLQNEIDQKVTDSEETARAAAEKAVAHENKIAASVKIIEENLADLSALKETISLKTNEMKNEIETTLNKNSELNSKIANTDLLYEKITHIEESISSTHERINQDANEIAKYLEESKELPEEVEKAKEHARQSHDCLDNMTTLLNHALKRKSDIDDLYKKIHGQDIEKEDGTTEHTDGLKDELENTYKKISENVKNIEIDLKTSIETLSADYKAQQDSQNEIFSSLIKKSNETINSVKSELIALMPGGMAAGLSAAYESKKIEETETLKNFEKNFKHAIYGLIAVSLIPFFVDIYLLAGKKQELLDVIKNTPSLIISIMPIYFPILWMAYSANKKINLSKRLIEEYTHKAVLGKTFSGLSNQIDTLPHEGQIKEDLRTKLLFNVLQVSAENPGKLITDYQKSDHPLMEALENSSKLSDSIESLSKIPGLGSLAATLSKKSEEIINEQAKKVNNGLQLNVALESPASNEQQAKQQLET